MIQDVLYCGRKVRRCQGRLAKKPFTYVQKLEEVWVMSSTLKSHMGFVCSQHFHWGRGKWWPSAAGSASGEQDKAKQRLQQCLLFMCDQSLKVLLLLVGFKQSKSCLLEGETLKV